MPIHIIFTKTALLLSRHSYGDWREIQADYVDYMASLGPWPTAKVSDYLQDEYAHALPDAAQQVAQFAAGDETVCELILRSRA